MGDGRLPERAQTEFLPAMCGCATGVDGWMIRLLLYDSCRTGETLLKKMKLVYVVLYAERSKDVTLCEFLINGRWAMVYWDFLKSAAISLEECLHIRQ